MIGKKKSSIMALVVFAILFTMVSFLKLHYNFLFLGLIFSESLLLIICTNKITKKRLILLVFVYLALTLTLKVSYTDKSLFNIGGLEKHQLIKRESYYKREAVRLYRTKIGKIYLNRNKVYIDKVFKKMSAILQPNLYFLSKSDSSYPFVLFPFFAIGTLILLYKFKALALTYILISLLASVFIETSKATLLFIPLINLTLFVGLNETFLYLRHKTK